MKIFGIGTDIVSVRRMKENLSRHGEKFARRILTENEFSEFQQSTNRESFLAKRFAAKEAMAKAMGTGFRDGLSMQHIGVGHDELGKPQLKCSGRALDFLQEKQISDSHVSLADEREHAVAFVTLEGFE